VEKVVILVFSGKLRGNCSSIADYICKHNNRTNTRIIRMHNFFKPCGDCGYECLQPEKQCPVINQEALEILEAICECELVYYIIPNYCGVPCANYYAFNERLVGWFNGDRAKMQRYKSVRKRFVFISNTENDAFQQVAAQHSNEKNDVLYLASRKYGKQSIAGDLLDSDAAKADLELFLNATHP